MYRSHTCGQLNASDVGREVILSGWIAKRRDHGKLIFIDLRDRTGLTQAVFIPKESGDAYQLAQGVRSEYVVTLKGTVNARPKGTINQKLPTGEVEVLVKDLQILNASQTPPFEIEDELSVTEETRLKYRYLDMRRSTVFNNVSMRGRLYRTCRAVLDERGFLECETPVLTKSTPEGARDYLVPSRLNPGKFYALPQSPQLFKQILMVAGFEKYYQIAKCFRDEDLRADRQPEFTQLDIEMSFVTEEDVYQLTEEIMKAVFKELKGIDLETPFPRLTYAQAQEKYKTDKPDLRQETGKEFAFVWVTQFPLLKFNADEQRWDSEHHPFTSPYAEDIPLFDTDPGKIKSRAYDIVLNGMELGSGSVRIHNQELQEKIFSFVGIDLQHARERFGFLLEAFQFGAPPHAGVAFGLDRLLTVLTGQQSIREVILFPKTSAGQCLMTDAPSSVDAKQLRELHIDIRKTNPTK
jgi:aspartyl-tRNA synthetase